MTDARSSNPPSPSPGDAGEFTFALKAGDETLQFRITNPPGPVPIAEAVPVLLNIAEALTQAAQRQHESAGKSISCGPGCGSCCRQLVPISGLERLHLQSLVDHLPDEVRRTVLERFRNAHTRLRESGILSDRPPLPDCSREERQQIGRSYFALGIPCPFLVDESCSIHLSRPMACREYLVSSPPECCASPSGPTIQMVPMPVKPSHAAMKLTAQIALEQPAWLPLIKAIDPDSPPSTTTTRVDLMDTVRRFLLTLSQFPIQR